ncbi:MAG: carbohydrate kinase family protein [Clostridiales bacterium]|nr:carbohydrate kinase family protein [Clostridiales bacterium]
MREKGFLCFGLVLLDILVSGVSRLPSHWEDSVLGAEVSRAVGGGAANSAAALGKLGARASVAGMIGSDDFGDVILSMLERSCVDASNLLRSKEEPSGVSIGLINPDGQRCFIVSRGANQRLDAAGLCSLNPDDCHFLLINGFFQFPQAETCLLHSVKQYSESGVQIAFDMASWDPSDRWMAAIKPFAPLIDVFFANSAQLKRLTCEEDLNAGAEMMLDLGVKTLVIKKGHSGCDIHDGHEIISVRSPDVSVIDTTGAGDVFDAAYILGVSKGWKPRLCGAFANTVAGLSCESLGAGAGVPDYERAVEAMNSFYPKGGF